MDMQAFVDGMNARWQRERAATQMTLGKLITILESMPTEQSITGLGRPHSYRGYYCDLALTQGIGNTTVGALLEKCRGVMGKALTGYKGGEFVMGELTPVWISDYGTTGKKLVTLNADGAIETADDDDDDD